MGLLIILGFFTFQRLRFEPVFSPYGFASSNEIVSLELFEGQFPKTNKEQSAIVILQKKQGWKSYADFLELKSRTVSIEKLHELKEIFSVTNLSFPKKGPFGMKQAKILHLENEMAFKKSYSKLKKMDYAHAKFLSSNGKYALFFLNLKKELSEASIQKLENIQGNKQSTFVFHAGYMERENQASMIRETIFIAALAVLLVILGFYFVAKSLRGLAIIAVTLLFNLSLVFIFMFLMDIPFSMNMIGIPCLIVILSFSDLMHIFYHQSILADQSKDDVTLRQTILKKIGFPMMLTSVTNGLGFIVFLVISDVRVMTELAVVSLFGILIAYLSSRFLILPLMSKNVKYILRKNLQNDGQKYYRIIKKISKRSRLVTGLTAILFIGLLIGLSSIFKIDFKAENYVQGNTKSYQTASILGEHFFGSHKGQISVRHAAKEGKWSKEYQQKLDKVEETIESIFNPLSMTSTNSLVKRFHQVRIGGNPAGYSLMNNLEPKEIEPFIEELGGLNLIARNGRISKIEFGFKDEGLTENLSKFKLLEKKLENFTDEKSSFQISGSSFISDKSVVKYSFEVIIGLSLGLLLTCLIVLFYFKSIRLAIGTLLVNGIPVFICMIVLLLSHVQINPQSLFLLSALLGLCLDDSLYLMAYRKKRIKDLNLFPIRVTSLVLALSFCALLGSSFVWLKEFALIFILGIVLAFFLDVLIYPLFMNLAIEEND